jgi:hypothetical protein
MEQILTCYNQRSSPLKKVLIVHVILNFAKIRKSGCYRVIVEILDTKQDRLT